MKAISQPTHIPTHAIISFGRERTGGYCSIRPEALHLKGFHNNFIDKSTAFISYLSKIKNEYAELHVSEKIAVHPRTP